MEVEGVYIEMGQTDGQEQLVRVPEENVGRCAGDRDGNTDEGLDSGVGAVFVVAVVLVVALSTIAAITTVSVIKVSLCILCEPKSGRLDQTIYLNKAN